MSFGRTFANKLAAEKYRLNGRTLLYHPDFRIRKLSKKLFPHRKKLFHVGTELDFLNFE